MMAESWGWDEGKLGASASADRATRATPRAAARLGHPASVPSAELLELAGRCQRAAGPDRELDALIHVAIQPGNYRLPSEADCGGDGERPIAGDIVCLRGFAGAVVSSPRYTATIDRAAACRPKGYAFTVSEIGIPGCVADARVWLPAQKGDGVSAFCENAATPALALCAAALRAHGTK